MRRNREWQLFLMQTEKYLQFIQNIQLIRCRRMQIGYLLHLYYGVRAKGTMDYLLCYADHGFSGNPYAAGMDRTYSLDALPQEYPSLGTGDCRNIALNITSAWNRVL